MTAHVHTWTQRDKLHPHHVRCLECQQIGYRSPGAKIENAKPMICNQCRAPAVTWSWVGMLEKPLCGSCKEANLVRRMGRQA